MSQHRKTPRPGTHIRVVEEEAALAIVLVVAASERTDPKSTNKLQSHDDFCPSKKSMYQVHDYWLGLQQTAAAATSCHRWLVLLRVAQLP